jgi:hypothetical protein
MSKPMFEVSKSEHAYPINLLTFSSGKPFDQVIADFEKQLGRLDQNKALSSPIGLTDAIKQMQGPTGLMIIGVLQMDQLLPSLVEIGAPVRHYMVGNPLIASKMAQHNTLAALYAPPRVLIYTRDAQTFISYDQPSTTFGRLDSDAILQTAKDLDQKFESLARLSLAQADS